LVGSRRLAASRCGLPWIVNRELPAAHFQE
jgi:hypothetical protein